MRKLLLLSTLALPFLFACPDKENQVKTEMETKRQEMVNEVGHKAKKDIDTAANKAENALNKGMDRMKAAVEESDKDAKGSGGW